MVANDVGVTNALNYTNDLSQALGGQMGTALTLTGSQTINASSGAVGIVASVDGNTLGSYRLFTTSSVNLSNSTILTINGSAGDQVVIDVLDNNPAFSGMIVLTGGITSDHVLFNMFGGNYTTPNIHTGGPTLTISTNGQITTGTFLDPNGGMQINHSELFGRFFGGDVVNQQIVSGADITAPPPTLQENNAPEPSTLALLGLALLGMAGLRRTHRRFQGPAPH